MEMGDADSRHLESENDVEQVAGLLDALDDDLFVLHNTINVLQERTQEAVTTQEKSYENFRQFFIGLNVIIIPLIMVAGFYYGLTEFFPSEMSQTVLRSLITLLLIISGSIGVPLYLGSLLAIYKFRAPVNIMPEEMIREIVAELVDNEPVDSETRSISSELIEDSLELMGVSDNHSNEGLEATATAQSQGTQVSDNVKIDPVLFSPEEIEICDLLMLHEEENDKQSDNEATKLFQTESNDELSIGSEEPPKVPTPKRWWMLERTVPPTE